MEFCKLNRLFKEIQDKIVFMKPNQFVSLDKKSIFNNLKECSYIAEIFWQDMKTRVDQNKKLINDSPKKLPQDIEKISKRYIKKINFECFLAPFFFELLRIRMRSLKIFITDLNISISSYLSGYKNKKYSNF